MKRRTFLGLMAAAPLMAGWNWQTGALAHTKVEGGVFYPGPGHGDFHSLFFPDGSVYDTALKRLDINSGWRQRKSPEEVGEIRQLASPPRAGLAPVGHRDQLL